VNAIPPNPVAWQAWVASLPKTELESVYHASLAAAELRALAGLAGARQVSSNVQPTPAAPSTTAPKAAPRAPLVLWVAGSEEVDSRRHRVPPRKRTNGRDHRFRICQHLR